MISINKFTWIGLFIAYLSIWLIGAVLKGIHGGPLNEPLTILREILTLLSVAGLFWIIIKGEHLTLDSIGISGQPIKHTLLWALVALLCCVAAAFASMAVIQAVGGEFGKSEPKVKLSLLTTTLVMLRAGIAEEVFFRGFIFERLQVILKSRWLAVALSLIPFALLHYQQGPAGMFMSFVLGSVLTVMYLWKRNLVANIIAHFLIDFIPNVLIPLVMMS